MKSDVEYENGQPLTDRKINTIYFEITQKISENVSKETVKTIINSERIIDFDPIRDFFKTSKPKTTGNIDKIVMSLGFLDPKNPTEKTLFAAHLVRKWLIGCVSCWHDKYSLLILVLIGRQNAGKTNWFRLLLPAELKEYYAESKHDANKDDMMLLGNKLILCDDEFGGKSKKEAKQIKEISAKQTITLRRPYGSRNEDFIRKAALCGTSNEMEIINDLTGNRRILPVEVKQINWDLYRSVDKADLWRELYQEWMKVGDGWMLSENDIATLEELTAENREVVSELELFDKYFEYDKNSFRSVSEIMAVLVKESGDRFLSKKKLGQILKNMGFQSITKKVKGAVYRGYQVRLKADISSHAPAEMPTATPPKTGIIDDAEPF